MWEVGGQRQWCLQIRRTGRQPLTTRDRAATLTFHDGSPRTGNLRTAIPASRYPPFAKWCGRRVMKVLVILEAVFHQTPDGRIWTSGVFTSSFFSRYLTAFSQVVVGARVRSVPAVPHDYK